MKVFEKLEEKSWAIKLVKDTEIEGRALLIACNSVTDEYICDVIQFESNGKIIPIYNVYNTLERLGYNPKEHNNCYNKDGSILIVSGR